MALELSGLTFFVSVGLVLCLHLLRQLVAKSVAILPPGPQGLVETLRRFLELSRTDNIHEIFERWGEQYGEIIYFHAFGQRMLILNDESVAIELLSKGATLYSDRPRRLLSGELVGFDRYTVMLPFYRSPEYRLHRKSFAAAMGASHQLKRHTCSITNGVKGFILRARSGPTRLEENVLLTMQSIMLPIVYGKSSVIGSEALLERHENAVKIFSVTAQSGTILAEVIPLFRYLPSFFPGAGYKNRVGEWSQLLEDLAEGPLREIEQRMASEEPVDCVIAEQLTGNNLTEEEKRILGPCFATMFSVGVDTFWSLLQWFFVFMLRHPDVLKKAQAEIDTIIGSDRLPVLEDRDRLPYVSGVVKEVLRLSVMTPTSVPRCLNQDDEYNGYVIPKGTVIFPNIWLMLRNPNIYSDPHTFNPERFIGPSAEPYPTVAFGFGRRSCPGRYFAETTIFIFVMQVLATLNIERVLDAQGNPLPISTGLRRDRNTIGPESFPCKLSVRNHKLVSLIEDSLSTTETL